jgi:ubiquinone/menaquinone biosynthesis C-methylase UbiE
MRVLDLGCGTGYELTRNGVGPDAYVVGVDMSCTRIMQAARDYPRRRFACAAGEALPFADESFDRVVCRLALPYMEIATALSEVRRVLRPGGSLFLSVHPPGFSLQELKNSARNPLASLYRLYVIANGCLFHATGATWRLTRKRVESFQTERGMRLAMRRARFERVIFRAVEKRLIVEAEKPGQLLPLPLASWSSSRIAVE